MNPLIRVKHATSPLAISLLLACFGLVPLARAVVPAPDGGYPGFNTAEGQNALFSLTIGQGNTAVGWRSLFSNAAGSFNTATGAAALLVNTGDQNTATGAGALLSNISGNQNTANGAFALFGNTTGEFNTANGYYALNRNTTGGGNTANGNTALSSNTMGINNTANGAAALSNNTTGSGNTALGIAAGGSVTTANNVICISAEGQNVSNSCYIGNIFEQVAGFGTQVFVNSDHKLGTVASSKRFKEEIRPTKQASEALFALRPVTFRYKKNIDPYRTSQFGLVAEDVEKVNPDLIVRDKKGRPYSVRYDQVNAMLLNEFLKEHKTVQELKREIAALTATVKEQAAQIQKVSAQIETGKAVERIASTNP